MEWETKEVHNKYTAVVLSEQTFNVTLQELGSLQALIGIVSNVMVANLTLCRVVLYTICTCCTMTLIYLYIGEGLLLNFTNRGIWQCPRKS